MGWAGILGRKAELGAQGGLCSCSMSGLGSGVLHGGEARVIACVGSSLHSAADVSPPPTCPPAGNSRTALGEGAEGTDVVLAAAINMQTLAQQMLSKDQQETSGSSSQSGGSTGADMKQQQAGGLALPSPAAVLVAAAGVLASAAQQQQEQGRGRQAANAVADLAAADAAVGTGAAASSAAASGTSGFESEAMPVASAQEVQALLEEEITAMSRLLDGR